MVLPTIADYPARFQFRFCPRCATPLVLRMRDHRERLTCPNDGWTLYPEPNLAATVVVEHEGGIVLLRRAIPPDRGIWHLPIGHLEFGEPPADAALRETHEETGLVLGDLVFLDYEYSTSYDDPAMFYLVFCFMARAIGGTLQVNEENDAAQVFAPTAIPPLKWRSQQRAIAAWRAQRAGQVWVQGVQRNDEHGS